MTRNLILRIALVSKAPSSSPVSSVAEAANIVIELFRTYSLASKPPTKSCVRLFSFLSYFIILIAVELGGRDASYISVNGPLTQYPMDPTQNT